MENTSSPLWELRTFWGCCCCGSPADLNPFLQRESMEWWITLTSLSPELRRHYRFSKRHFLPLSLSLRIIGTPSGGEEGGMGGGSWGVSRLQLAARSIYGSRWRMRFETGPDSLSSLGILLRIIGLPFGTFPQKWFTLCYTEYISLQVNQMHSIWKVYLNK